MYHDRETVPETQPAEAVLPAETLSAPDDTANTLPQSTEQQPVVIEKIHRATRRQEGKRWYYVKLQGQRGTRVVPEDSIPQKMKEAFHLHKTVAGKAKKRKHRHT